MFSRTLVKVLCNLICCSKVFSLGHQMRQSTHQIPVLYGDASSMEMKILQLDVQYRTEFLNGLVLLIDFIAAPRSTTTSKNKHNNGLEEAWIYIQRQGNSWLVLQDGNLMIITDAQDRKKVYF